MAPITLVHDCDAERRATPNALNGDFRDCFIEGDPVVGHGLPHDGGIILVGVTVPGGKGSEYERRGLFRYDLAAFIPASATLTAGVWHIYIGATDATAAQPFLAVRTRRHDWKEDEATWNDYKTGSNWTTPGAEDPDDDRDILDPGTIALGTLDTTGWHTKDIFDLVDDAWTVPARNGICTFIVERYTYLNVQGMAQIHAKPPPPTNPYVGTHHLRVTYTLDGRTFQVMVA